MLSLSSLVALEWQPPFPEVGIMVTVGVSWLADHIASFCIILFRISNVIPSIRHLNFLIALHMLHVTYAAICLRWNYDHTGKKMSFWRNLPLAALEVVILSISSAANDEIFYQNEEISLSVHTLHICIISYGIKGWTRLIQYLLKAERWCQYDPCFPL